MVKLIKMIDPEAKITPLGESIISLVKLGNLKKIKNCSLQGLSLVVLLDSGEFDNIWIQPREIIEISEISITQQIINLHKRRLIQISN